ncbi:uncharacterized protein MEPE_04746 [Melanopsichium pennsylvanicum]|uniref:Uncharacterized protein n=2 Tax=Melanopsichium pennsylvanicum TaxID=63383 RepID=A0AAJ4XQH9_9BASI|nr:uncharacterized protein BN887_00966 [Melanopsichium pennsylvanicum 4]SNX86037.1 uncharacterized protein MEPE_04746 [Melanopsichium pennsylvanicum]
MRQGKSSLFASSEEGRIKFPAFVRLPPAALPAIRRSLSTNDQGFVKLINFEAVSWPLVASAGINNFRRPIAQAWKILEDQIRAITVNLDGQRVLIENEQDWQEWLSAFFWRSKEESLSSSYSSQFSSRAPLREVTIEPSHIHVIVNHDIVVDLSTSSAGVRASANALPTYSETTTANSSERSSTLDHILPDVAALNTTIRTCVQDRHGTTPPAPSIQQPSQLQQNPSLSQQRTSPSTHPQTASQASSTPSATQHELPESLPASNIASNVVASVLQALQPQLQSLPLAVASMLSGLPAQLAGVHANTSVPSGHNFFPPAARSGPSVPENGIQPPPAAPTTAFEAPRHSTNATGPPVPNTAASAAQGTVQRQSLIGGLFDELSRLRTQPSSTSAPPQPPQEPIDDGSTVSGTGGEMTNELGQAFEQMLAQQRAAATASTTAENPATAGVTAAANITAEDGEHEDQNESLTAVSTPSTSSTLSSGPRSGSRSPRRTTFLSTTTLSLLTILTCLVAFISPTLATPDPFLNHTIVNPRLKHLSLPYSLSPRSNISPPSPRTNSRHLHLCKCTCFQTNSTLVPLYATSDPAKPCATCTRQFCLDQGLDICKGAKLEHTDHDTGTGLEGDVWAKCFERDSGKDQTIITLYILVVLGLVAWAGFRGRIQGWVQTYQQIGPQGLYSAVREAPWRRSR